jgi:hypothetical protein
MKLVHSPHLDRPGPLCRRNEHRWMPVLAPLLPLPVTGPMSAEAEVRPVPCAAAFATSLSRRDGRPAFRDPRSAHPHWARRDDRKLCPCKVCPGKLGSTGSRPPGQTPSYPQNVIPLPPPVLFRQFRGRR